MSHITKIKANEERRLSALKKMCEISSQLGLNWQFNENKGSHRMFDYGGRVKNSPAMHEIEVGAKYSIGVNEISSNGHTQCELLWDSYSTGGLQEVIGREGEKLSDLYNAAAAIEAVEDNYDIFNPDFQLEYLEDGELQLTVDVND